MIFHLQQAFVTLCALWVVAPAGCGAYPGGTPDSACDSMFPTGHGVSAQRSRPPYQIKVQKRTYTPGETLTVQLVPSKAGGWYRGVYLQARQVGCGLNVTRLVGVFTSNDLALQTRHCFGRIHSTVTHTSNSQKGGRTVYWTAPVLLSGHIVMRATFVRSVEEFWTDVDSHVLVDLEAQEPPRCLHRPPTPGSPKRPSPDGQAGVNSFHVSTAPRQRASVSPLLALAASVTLLFQ